MGTGSDMDAPAGLYLCIGFCMFALEYRVQAACLAADCAASWQMPLQRILHNPAAPYTLSVYCAHRF